jgi:hypothetical protein
MIKKKDGSPQGLGAAAWSRTGDPDLGDWGPPEVLVRHGVIPNEFEAGGGVQSPRRQARAGCRRL